MPFRIDPKKPFDNEIRRAGLELIDDTVTILRDQPSGSHEAVHDARKRFKRLLKKVYLRLPMRPAIRFVYAYVVRLGFLDGVPGLVFCTLLAFYEHHHPVRGFWPLCIAGLVLVGLALLLWRAWVRKEPAA